MGAGKKKKKEKKTRAFPINWRCCCAFAKTSREEEVVDPILQVPLLRDTAKDFLAFCAAF